MHNYHVSMYTELSSLLLAFYVPQDQYAATPLQTACVESQLQVASYLISRGANVNYNKNIVNNCLCYFVIISLLNMVSLQLGATPLHRVCDKGHIAVAKLLIESGAKLETKDDVSVELLVAFMGMGSQSTCHQYRALGIALKVLWGWLSMSGRPGGQQIAEQRNLVGVTKGVLEITNN